MNAPMDFQITLGFTAKPTTRMRTFERFWAVPGMSFHLGFKVAFPFTCEFTARVGTFEGPGILVNFHMLPKISTRFTSELAVGHVAFERPLSCMNPHMSSQIRMNVKCTLTKRAKFVVFAHFFSMP